MRPTIVRGTARRLGITRPIPTRELARAEVRRREGHTLTQALLGAFAALRSSEPVAGPVVERQKLEISPDGRWRRRCCPECGYFDDTYCWAPLVDRQHLCRRDDTVHLIIWPGGW